MSAAPKPALSGQPPPWYKPAIALTHIIDPDRRALALAHRWLTMGDWGTATEDERVSALELIRQARRNM